MHAVPIGDEALGLHARDPKGTLLLLQGTALSRFHERLGVQAQESVLLSACGLGHRDLELLCLAGPGRPIASRRRRCARRRQDRLQVFSRLRKWALGRICGGAVIVRLVRALSISSVLQQAFRRQDGFGRCSRCRRREGSSWTRDSRGQGGQPHQRGFADALHGLGVIASRVTIFKSEAALDVSHTQAWSRYHQRRHLRSRPTRGWRPARRRGWSCR
mmetsp:Transcript_25378/g.63846  ORF Transcript_25378/g.63846 Transcript_25378/m.63846 type:complete len:217 (-) Transcript_25378:1088-1738(-)